MSIGTNHITYAKTRCVSSHLVMREGLTSIIVRAKIMMTEGG